MVRPLKSGVDYFPLDVQIDDKLKLIQAQHKIVGFGIVIKLYQKIYASDYWLKWDKKASLVFSDENNVDINEVIAIINSCLEWEIFDRKIFEKHSVLTSRGIQKRFFEIVSRRTQISIVKDYLLVEVPEREKQTIVIDDINPVNDCKSTQSKVNKKERKDNVLKPDSVSEQTWKDFLTHRKEKKAPVTKTVLNGFIREAEKAGYTLEKALQVTMERGWQGFKADWVKDKKTTTYNMTV